jgi:hypothetical protein
MIEEDEAFNDIEKQSMWRKRAVAAAIATSSQREQVIEDDDDIQEYKKPWRGLNWGEVPENKTKSEEFLHGARWAEKQLKERNA